MRSEISLDVMAGRLAPELDGSRLAALYKLLPSDAPEDWRALAAVAALALAGRRCLGISGAQGSGKSTLAALIAEAIRLDGRSAALCSLDDFYLSRARRQALAAQVHPLLATRGPPGTHDVALALQVVRGALAGRPTALPRFDKGRDEPLPASRWPVVQGVRTFILEGWCLGVQPQPAEALARPVNALEAQEDVDGVWRRYVNARCADYAPLWRLVDWWIFLEAPDMAAVRRWRKRQEDALPAKARMSGAALDRFVAHYERLTFWQKEHFAPQADWRLQLGRDHRLA